METGSDVLTQMAATADIAFEGALLHKPDEALRREWLVTNQIGGYASGTLSTANTRRYHGLLVAAVNPPAGRALLLSKLEETLIVSTVTDNPDTGSANTVSIPLSTNVYPNSLHPQGYAYLDSWHSLPVPTWRWKLPNGILLEKQIWMAPGQNTTFVAYRLVQAPANHKFQISLVPLLAWRNYHSHMVACDYHPPVQWTPTAGSDATGTTTAATLRITLPPIDQVTTVPTELSLTLNAERGIAFATPDFAARPDWYYRFQHPVEQQRGLDYQEDLYTPGTLTVTLTPDQPIIVTASTEAPPTSPQVAWESVQDRQIALLSSTFNSSAIPASSPDVALEGTAASHSDPFALRLALASDAFVVEVPDVRTSIIAGYPWFADWGRDTMIALSGLCLTTGRPQIARQILLSFAAHVDKGMLPNRFPDASVQRNAEKIEKGHSSEPSSKPSFEPSLEPSSKPSSKSSSEPLEYNTVDATLWYVVAIYRYVEATGDLAILSETLWPVLQQIVSWHQRGTRYNIHVDPTDHLLAAGAEGVQLTWMDARVGDHVVTPRIGKPVEINALWYNVLQIMAHFADRLSAQPEPPVAAQPHPQAEGDKANLHVPATYRTEAEAVRHSFLSNFARPDNLGLYDVLPMPINAPTPPPDLSIRPNQIFALSLPFPVVGPETELAKQIISVVERELLTPYGLRTLSPHDPAFRPRYQGGVWERDTAYHQGTVWPWLLGAYAEAYNRVRQDSAGAKTILKALAPQLETFGIGNLAEIFDATNPQRPCGCIAQAWSIAETLRVWMDLAI